MFRGKKYQESAKLVEKNRLYDPAEAVALACQTSKAKFDETIELHIRLGVDSRHADQQVRGAVVLPNGTGRPFAPWYSARARTSSWLRTQALTTLAVLTTLRRSSRRTGSTSTLLSLPPT